MGTTTLSDSGARNLTQLARQEGVSLAALLRANPGISNPNIVGHNRRIRIPGSYEAKTQSAASQARQLARVFESPTASGGPAAFQLDPVTGQRISQPEVTTGQIGGQASAPNVSTRALEAFFGAQTQPGQLSPHALLGPGRLARSAPLPGISTTVTSREQWQQRQAALLSQVSGRAGIGVPIPDLFAGISGRAGVGLATGPTIPSAAGVSGVAGVGQILRPAPLQGHAFGVAGTGLVQRPFFSPQFPTAPPGVSGRAGVGLQTGPQMPGVGGRGTPRAAVTAAQGTAIGGTTARVLAEETAQIPYNISAYTDAAYRASLKAISETGPRPSAEGVSMQIEEILARDYNRPMTLLGAGINYEQLDALAAQIGNARGIAGLTGEQLLIAAGYKKLVSGNWVAASGSMAVGGGYGGGGGGGGGGGFRYPGYAGGGGGSRGVSYGASPLVNWRIRYTA